MFVLIYLIIGVVCAMETVRQFSHRDDQEVTVLVVVLSILMWPYFIYCFFYGIYQYHKKEK